MTHRKLSGLTQEDIAILIGASSPSQISRYEGRARNPDLKAAIAYSILFEVPMSVLFPELFREINRHINVRAKYLEGELAATESALHQKYRLEVLSKLIERTEDK